MASTVQPTPAALHHTSQTMIDINNRVSNRNAAPRHPPPGWGPYGDPYYYARGYVYGPTVYVPGSTHLVPSVYAPALVVAAPAATARPVVVSTTAKPALTLAPTSTPFLPQNQLTQLPVAPTRAPPPPSSSPVNATTSLVSACCLSVVLAGLAAARRG
jgi:hypothetical protein